MPRHWASDSVFYHIYPIGLCGCPLKNDFLSSPVERLNKIYDWIPHIKELGANAVYLGPVFESGSHGYDTADYYSVDRRLGTNDSLKFLVRELHLQGIRVILDGVFNHVGRDFPGFQDLIEKGEDSEYCSWFEKLDFRHRSPKGDRFSYQGWNGCYDLVKLNLKNDAVKNHLLRAVKFWIQDFGIDGLRLDAADCLDIDFIKELSRFSKNEREDFWMMGEIIHGDYRKWANEEMLDSVTNYECYKGLYSSLLDKNYFEIAYSLKRQFSDGGLYTNIPLYNFADNHDVNRVMSSLQDSSLLYPLYCLLFTMPGVPSVYYGSEWGLEGKKSDRSDAALRPDLDIASAWKGSPEPDLCHAIARLSGIRKGSEALKYGNYRELVVKSQQILFSRKCRDQEVVVALNASGEPASSGIDSSSLRGRDLLNGGKDFSTVPPRWARIISLE